MIIWNNVLEPLTSMQNGFISALTSLTTIMLQAM